jgi:hypothetical protein
MQKMFGAPLTEQFGIYIHTKTYIHTYIHTYIQADNYVYIFGGLESATTYAKNVWRTADGVSWTETTASVYSPARDTKDALALSVGGKIYLFGGVCMCVYVCYTMLVCVYTYIHIYIYIYIYTHM